MMICYAKINGRAVNLRLVADTYQPQAGEITLPGETLPMIETLHDQSYLDTCAADAARGSAIDNTIAGFSFGGTTLAQLKAMDSPAFDAWWSANVTNLAQANAVLKLIARAMLRRVL